MKIEMIDRSRMVFASAIAATMLLAGSTIAGEAVTPQARMGDPLPGLSPEQLMEWELGREAFNTPLDIQDGLGPVFNKSFCGNCHAAGNIVGGAGSQTVTRFGRIDEFGDFDPMIDFGGSLLQASSISVECAEGFEGENSTPTEATIVEERVTNGALGFGLVEAIPDGTLINLADNGTGIAHMVPALEDPPKSPFRVGKFGWKAVQPTVLSFSADASLNEMGLTNRLIGIENDPNGMFPPNLGDPDFCDEVADPEDSIAMGNGENKEFIDVVSDFQRYLAPPPQTPKTGMTGEQVFNDIGCNQCHVTSFVTSDDPDLEEVLQSREIKPYGDFLLHDMGAAGSQIVQGDADAGMMRTAPLWGLLPRDPMWHDGRFGAGTFAQRVTNTIVGIPGDPEQGTDPVLGHLTEGSEAFASAQAFQNLPQADKDALINFLGSLGQAEFDSDGNNSVELNDFLTIEEGVAGFRSCFMTDSVITPDDPCAIHDIDQDTDVDLDDFASFQIAYDEEFNDCNNNGEIDLLDILTGESVDENNDGVPDSCVGCVGDVNQDGSVDGNDLAIVLGLWGTSNQAADINGDGVVNASDLGLLLGGWGEC